MEKEINAMEMPACRGGRDDACATAGPKVGLYLCVVYIVYTRSICCCMWYVVCCMQYMNCRLLHQRKRLGIVTRQLSTTLRTEHM